MDGLHAVSADGPTHGEVVRRRIGAVQTDQVLKRVWEPPELHLTGYECVGGM
jgi:hypothetical protein